MKCKVCGKEFELKKEDLYFAALSEAALHFCSNVSEAFDCPYCGCQNIVNERLLKVKVNVDEKILNESHGTE